MATNGIPFLAQALQAHLARKHQAGMYEAQRDMMQQRDAEDAALRERQWGREDLRHQESLGMREEDLARALEQQTWERQWKQQAAQRDASTRAEDLSIQAAREKARDELERWKMQQTIALQEKAWGTRKDIAKGHDDARVSGGAGRGGSGAPKSRKDQLIKLITDKRRVLAGYKPPTYQDVQNSPEAARRQKEAQALQAEIDALNQEYTALVTGMEQEKEMPTPPGQQGGQPQPKAPPRGRAADY